MSNMFRNTGITYFQVPHSFVEESIVRDISKTALQLYIFLLRHVERNTKLTLKFTGRQIVEGAFVAESQVSLARKCLVDLGLIMIDKVNGGAYEYTICNPDTGKAVPNMRARALGYDFNKLTPDELTMYFLKRLHEQHITNWTDTENGIKAICPLCHGERETFEASLRSSAWNCHKCNEKGKLVHLELALAIARGEGEITTAMAHKRVRDVLIDIGVQDVTVGDPEAEYDYVDDDGVVQVTLCRFPGKRFRTMTVDKSGARVYKAKGMKPMLYRANEAKAADVVFVVEGERDADRVHGLQLKDNMDRPVVGTCNSGGANHWKPEHTERLRDKRVICIGDNDERGQRHMDEVVEALTGVASSVYRVPLPTEFKDVSEFLDAHYLRGLIKLLPQSWIEPPFVEIKCYLVIALEI